jgi:hypothetical protein
MGTSLAGRVIDEVEAHGEHVLPPPCSAARRARRRLSRRSLSCPVPNRVACLPGSETVNLDSGGIPRLRHACVTPAGWDGMRTDQKCENLKNLK